MLEIGVGFHQELTGQENIYLNGSILGLDRRTIDRLLPAIVEFSELEDFIDVPVKNYSSGMHARLGFSIAAHMDPDILLIDEALSVGDESFQRKCHQRMREFRARRKTIMIVSHNLAAVAALCDRVCLLVHGKIVAMDTPDVVLPQYQQLAQSLRPSGERPRLRAAPAGGVRR
jgi:ABC-type polysaccharide/polyol phosphate transport system ATPase subunit